MPVYEYRCTNCGYDFDITQRFSDDPLTVCPKCDGKLRKVISSSQVIFKGSGFYSTDSHSHHSSSSSHKEQASKTSSKPESSTSKTTQTSSSATAANSAS